MLFISHSSTDGEQSAEMRDRLVAQGYEWLFLDFDTAEGRGIQAGRSWEQTLYDKLDACQAVIAICTNSYLASHWCFAEVALARMQGKPIFTVLANPLQTKDPETQKDRIPSILMIDQYVDLRTDPDKGYDQLFRGLKYAGLLPSVSRAPDRARVPYPGLAAFQMEDASYFFGRERKSEEGLQCLRRQQRLGRPGMLMVLGSSGSGKSSLVRAGILPRLQQESASWRLVGPMRPGAEPLRAVAEAFARAGHPKAEDEIHRRLWAGLAKDSLGPEDREDDLASFQAAVDDLKQRLPTSGDIRLASLLDELRTRTAQAREANQAEAADRPILNVLARELLHAHGHPEASVLLVVDQFEESLGDREEGASGTHFLALLREAIEVRGGPLLALGTMRSDYLGRFQVEPALVGFEPATLTLGPMTRSDIRRVIEEPARLTHLRFEKGLVDDLLDETGGADALPLLAFTLRVMWDRYGQDSLFEKREYQELGGIAGAVASEADAVLETALAGDAGRGREAVRRAFLRMARVAEDGSFARRPARWADFDPAAHPALEAFEVGRLLVRHEDTAEVAHEALFRSWTTLVDWLEAHRDVLAIRDGVRRATGQWIEGGRRVDDLWRGARLTRALELLGDDVTSLEAEEQDFLRSAQEEQERLQALEEARRQREIEVEREKAEIQARYAEQMRLEAEKAREALRAASTRTLLSEGRATLGNLVALEIRDPAKAPTGLAALHRALADPVEIVSIRAHGDVVDGAWWSADGRQVLSSAHDKEVRLWDAETGALRMTFSGHTGWVSAAALSPDGTRVASASRDGTVRLWDAESGAEIRCIRGAGEARAVAFSPDSSHLAVALGDGTAHLLDAPNGAEAAVLRGHEGTVLAVAYDPAGGRVLTASEDATVRIWDAQTGGETLCLRGHSAAVRSAAFSPDGARVATASADATARVWDATHGAEITTLEGHKGGLTAVAFDPNGVRLATGSDDTTAGTWDAHSGERVASLHGHERKIRSLAFSPEGTQVLTASNDKTARLWNAATGELLACFKGHTEEIRTAAFSPEGNRILTASDDRSVRIWKPDLGEELLVLRAHGDGLYGAAVHPDGSKLLSACDDGTARIWDAATGRLLGELSVVEGGPMRSAVFSPDANPGHARVLTASSDRARLWSVRTGEVTAVLDGHRERVRKAAFSPDGRLAVTCSDDRTARIWDVASGTTVTVLEGHRSKVFDAAFSPDGGRLATASDDATLRLWDLASGETEAVFEGHLGKVLAVAFGPDGKLLLSASKDHTARLWDATTGVEIETLRGHTDWVSGAAFSPDGSQLATASDDRTIRLWSVDGTPLFQLLGHTSEVHGIAFSPDGRQIFSAADDGTARLWPNPPDIAAYLLARVRARTRLSLSPDDYQQILGASPEQAQESAAACAKCVPVFFEQLGSASPVDWQAYLEAWQAYSDCLASAHAGHLQPQPSQQDRRSLVEST